MESTFKIGSIIRQKEEQTWVLTATKYEEQTYPGGTLWRVENHSSSTGFIHIRNLITNERARGCPSRYFERL